MKTLTKRATCRLATSMAIALVFAAAQTAQAATDTSWNGGIGGTMSSPKELYNKGNWKSGKVPSTSYNLVFGVNSLVATNNHTSANIANDIKVNGGDYTFLGSLEFETLWTVDSASKNTIVKKGDWKLTYGYRQAIAENSYSAITNASGNMKITGEHYIRVGEGKNSTAIIENQAGNWTLAHHFKVANGEGSKGEIYWRKGNLSFSKDYVLYIGNGKNSTGKVEIYGGTWTLTNNMHVASGVGAAATLLLKGGTINAKGSFYIGNNTGANGAVAVDSGKLNVASEKTMYIGRGGGTGTLTVNGGTLSLGGDCVFGNGDSGSEGTLTINGGTVTVASGKWTKSGGGTGTINLNGGTFVTQHIRDEQGSLAVNFNGGTLKSNEVASNGLLCHGAGSGIAVTVGEKGGTIDTGDFGISIPVAISGAGGMTFKGGGVVTLASGNTYTGKTTVELGTTVHVAAQNEIGGGLAVSVPAQAPADGVYTLLVCDGKGVFTDSVLTGVIAPDNSRLLVTTDGKSVVCIYGADLGPIWVGGASGSLGEAANWANNAVPGAGVNCVIGSVAAASLTNPSGSAFAPASITFPADSAAVAISGENPITGIAAITNLSPTVSHTINVPVAFADKILVVQGAMSWEQKSGTSVRFAGGVTGTTFADGTARYLDGAYSLSTGAGWVANTQGSNNRWGISTGSSLTCPEATHINELYVGSGAAFTTGVHRTSARLLCYNYGEYVVTNEFAATFPEEGTHYCGWDSISNGKFKFEKITLSGGTGSNPILKFGNASSSTADTGTQQFYIGRGGLCFAEGACNTLCYEAGGAKNNATVRIDPWHGDYTIHTKSASNPTDFTVSTKTYFGTTDESGKACTVTDDGVINSYDAGEIHFDGKGTFVVNAVGKATCPATVHGGSGTTLAIKAGKKLTTGLITVNSGATLQVSKSGTVSLGGLMLKSGATLGFTFTKRDAAPILKLSSAFGEFTVPIRVCSFNIRCISSSDTGDKAWDNRKAALVKLVKNIDPDIIGFQEVKDDQFTYLKQQLPDYDFLSKNRGGSSGGNEAVSIAWRKARFSKTAGGTFWLSGTPSKESKFEESDLNRICTWALFNDSCTGRQFCFANTHLDLKEAARPKQMQVIMDQLSNYFDKGVPFALTGDMNCDERASPIKDVAYAHLSDACLVSRTAPTGPWRTYNGWNYKDASAESPCASVMKEPVSERNIGGRSRIDFMLTSQNVGVASFAIRNDPQSGKKQYPSDHFPIVGELLPATGGGGKYKVKVGRSCPHVYAGRHVLTQGAKLANADNIDFDLPKWVKRAAVEDGEIVLYAKPLPFTVIVR